MPKLDNGLTVPYTIMGNNVGASNETMGAVLVEMHRTGKNPLEGTGLTFGEVLNYDTSPNVPVAEGASPGTPAVPNSIPFSPSNPYPGMGKF